VEGNAALTLVLGLLTAVLAVLAYAWVVRRTEHRAPAEVAARDAVAGLGRGTLLGVALFSAVILAIALLGDYRVDGAGSVTGALGPVGFMAAAVTEELIFRGILFRIVEERAGTWGALAVTGLVFGLSHLLNPHADLWGAVAIAVEAGGMLAAAYAATRSLWLPIGLNFGWNVAESAIFGTEVSGNDTAKGLLDGVTSGSSLVTGGAFGPEASLYALAGGVLATLAFLRLARTPAGATDGDGLHALVEQSRRAGQPVEFTEEGCPATPSGAAGATAYRVVQEGLTNALKYAHGCPTVVRVRHGAGEITVEVRTEGTSARAPGGSGRGLAGLRARVSGLGGEFTAGEVTAGGGPGGGFVVQARIPATSPS